MAAIQEIRIIAGRIMEKKASAQELEVFKQYLSSCEEQTAMEEIFIPGAFPQPEPEILLNEMQKQLMVQYILSHQPVKERKVINIRRVLTGVAASLLLCIGAYTAWRWVSNSTAKPIYTDVYTGYGQQKVVLMPDSSRVVMNAGSHLRYAYTKTLREVFLEGEAFFKVTRNPQKVFVVHSNRLATRVLGTSFNIRAYKDDSAVTVQVRTGKVKVTVNAASATDSAKEVVLLPSDQAIYLEQAEELLVRKVDTADIAGWTMQKIIFTDQPVAVILHELERIYNIRFSTVNKTALQRRYTMRLKKMPLANTLETVGALTGLRFQIKDAIVVVK